MAALKNSVLGAALLTISIACIPAQGKETPSKVSKIVSKQSLMLSEKEDSIIRIVAVGDIMMGTNFPSAAYLPPLHLKLLEPMLPFLKGHDIVFGNLEGTVLNEGGEVKKCEDSTKCYAFRQPVYLLDQIADAGFNLLSIANNHVGDFGYEGRKSTIAELEKRKIHFAGQNTHPTDTFSVKGKKIGFIAFAPNTGCLQIDEIEEARERVRNLKKVTDIVIVSFHGGAEGSNHQHVPKKTEMYYGENRGDVYAFAHAMIDEGADLILGHGPHVTRAADLFKGRFIAYSLGNFCTYARFNLKGANGVAPLLQIELYPNGEFKLANVVSTMQKGEGGPILDPEQRAFGLLKSLTQSDIPEAPLRFERGVIQPKY